MPYDQERLQLSVARILKRLEGEGESVSSWAERADVAEGMIRAIIAGRTRSPGIEKLYQLAAAANVELWELLGEDVPWRTEYLRTQAELDALKREMDDLRARLRALAAEVDERDVDG